MMDSARFDVEAGDYGWHMPSGVYGTVREIREDGMVVFGIGVMREPLIVPPAELEILDPRRSRPEVERDRLIEAGRALVSAYMAGDDIGPAVARLEDLTGGQQSGA